MLERIKEKVYSLGAVAFGAEYLGSMETVQSGTTEHFMATLGQSTY
jgi:hypothetical protein